MAHGRCFPLQDGMMFTVPVLVKELSGLMLHSLKVGQIGVLPDVQLVILMEPFDRTVALRVTHRRKKQLRAHL